jgi:cytochrome d ubiquinol oxidase subunit I
VAVVHVAFQIMVAAGMIMVAIAVWGGWLAWRRKALFESRLFLQAAAAAAPLGFIAIETGWVVTEVGRQPWIIYGVMRTADAVTPIPGLSVSLITFTLLYIFLAVVVVWLLRRRVIESPRIFVADPEGRRDEEGYAVN